MKLCIKTWIYICTIIVTLDNYDVYLVVAVLLFSSSTSLVEDTCTF
jgi:hypothetical protein